MVQKWNNTIKRKAAKGRSLSLDEVLTFLTSVRDSTGDAVVLLQVFSRMSGEVSEVRVSHNVDSDTMYRNLRASMGIDVPPDGTSEDILTVQTDPAVLPQWGEM